MTLPFAEAAALALVESVTRLLPLADGGHAALLDLLFGIDVGKTLLLSVGAGTWLAAAVFLRTKALAAARAAMRDAGPSGRDARVLLAGSLAMLLVELAVRERVTSWGREPMLVGAGLVLSAAAMASTIWAPRGTRRVPTVGGALLAGAVQGAAALPGLSQVGLGLACLVWLGLTEESAFETCLLMMIPAWAVLLVVAAASPAEAAAWTTSPGLVLLSACVGLVMLSALREVLRRRLLPFFSLYLVPLGVATIAWGYARP
jgi:undecaprenyl-diphosphatase